MSICDMLQSQHQHSHKMDMPTKECRACACCCCYLCCCRSGRQSDGHQESCAACRVDYMKATGSPSLGTDHCSINVATWQCQQLIFQFSSWRQQLRCIMVCKGNGLVTVTNGICSVLDCSSVVGGLSAARASLRCHSYVHLSTDCPSVHVGLSPCQVWWEC
jgi:hypothetical protein